jgi:hypothetical protein
MRDWRHADRWLMGEAWTGSRIGEHATQLCDVIGPRPASSESERLCINYICGQLASCGVTPERQEFQSQIWTHGTPSAHLLPESVPIDFIPYIGCRSFAIRAPVVDVGFGTAREIDSISDDLPRGAVAVMSYGAEPFSQPVPVPYRLRNLAARGAAAVLVIDAKDGDLIEISVETESKDAPTANVVSELPGGIWPQEHLVISAHHDTVFGSPR